MILIITYDLHPAHDYTQFYEALKTQGTSWWHYLSSTWLISTTKRPDEVLDALRSYLGPNDRLLIAEMGNVYNGWLPKDAWDWIQKEQASTSYAALPGSVLAGPTAPHPWLSATGGLNLMRGRHKKDEP